MDLYIVASRVEGGPLALLETMATGVPLVSTNVGMVPDVIEHGKEGYICDINDVDAIYQNTIRLIDDPAKYEQIVKNAFHKVQEYSWQKIIKQYENLYLSFHN